MIVIARVKSVSKHNVGQYSTEEEEVENNPFGLEENEIFFKC